MQSLGNPPESDVPKRGITAHIQWGRKQGGGQDELVADESVINTVQCSNPGTFGGDRAGVGVGEDESESLKALVFDDVIYDI